MVDGDSVTLKAPSSGLSATFSPGAGEKGQRQRAGMTSCLSFAGYLRLLDWSGRLFRPGKARVPKEVAEILQRLGSSPDLWHHRLRKLRETARIYGVVFGVTRQAINRFAECKGVSRLANTTG